MPRRLRGPSAPPRSESHTASRGAPISASPDISPILIPMRPRRDAEAPYLVRIPPFVLFLLATVFGAYAGWQHVRGMVQQSERPISVPLAHGLAMRMPYWYAWALFIPLLQWLARRYPLERMRW